MGLHLSKCQDSSSNGNSGIKAHRLSMITIRETLKLWIIKQLKIQKIWEIMFPYNFDVIVLQTYFI